MKSAFAGADSVFAATVSDFAPDQASSSEYKQVIAIADAAKATGSFLVFRYSSVLRLVWSPFFSSFLCSSR